MTRPRATARWRAQPSKESEPDPMPQLTYPGAVIAGRPPIVAEELA